MTDRARQIVYEIRSARVFGVTDSDIAETVHKLASEPDLEISEIRRALRQHLPSPAARRIAVG